MQHLGLMGLEWGLQHISIFEERYVNLPVDPGARGSMVALASLSTTSHREVILMKTAAGVFKGIKTFKGCRIPGG